MDEYDIRSYAPDDREAFLDLYNTVMGETKGRDWFEWKYAGNPYAEDVPMILATRYGRVVGARPFFALRMVVNDVREIAYQPADTMVHPDHRRKGLFTRMTEYAIDRYADECAFFFNFPNHRSRPGYLKLDWEIVEERSSYYRIEDPRKVAAAQGGKTPALVAGTVATPLVRAYNRVRTISTIGETDVEVRQYSEVPAETLAGMYDRAIPERIHAVRDERFYKWRYNNPDWTYTTYIAREQAHPSAAIIVGSTTVSAPRSTGMIDVLPLGTAPREVVGALIERTLADNPETELFSALGSGMPRSVLREYGFFPDTVPPLSSVTETTTHVVKTFDGTWTRHGLDLTDPESWLLTYAEKDTR